MRLTRNQVRNLKRIEPFLPFDNPTFNNPDFEEASYRVLIARLSPFQDVDRSIPHLFLFQETRRALPEAFVDLAFFPPAEDRAYFEQAGIPPLIGVHSLRSADEFDLVLISNAYTLELINLPYLLIHAGMPLFSSQRGPEWPLLILGGSNALAAQSIIREDKGCLVDGIFFGEGEGRVGELVRSLHHSRGTDKRDALAQAAQEIPGFWAATSSASTSKAVLHTAASQFLPLRYPMLNTLEAHTANLQITHGCPAFCSFCFEGYDRKPYRELPLSDILSAAHKIKQAQGVEELNLYSFNFNTHTDILEMLLRLHRVFDRVALKSQRLDVLQRVGGLLEAEVEADKRDFTLGIEGISERQRAWLHKSLSSEDINALLHRLLGLKIRRIKLFYILTGHETAEDMAEFRGFLKWLKATRRALNRRVRVIFSFGLLIRMPFTPLRYDRLILDEQEWRPLIGRAKSACETNGFEFRLAFDWPTYCATQVLALGGYWLVDPIVELARQGHCFDTAVAPEYWDELRTWMERTGHWNDTFLGQKEADYPFALEFVASDVPAEFLYRQYQEAQDGVDGGYCLGSEDQSGRCLGCGACVDPEERRAITHHTIRQPDPPRYMAQLRGMMDRKRHLEDAYYRLRVSATVTGVLPAFLNAFVFREILIRYPELVRNLLSVRESLFTAPPNEGRFPMVSGETVFALKAWDAQALEEVLGTAFSGAGDGTATTPGRRPVRILGPAPGFEPGTFARLHLEVHLPGDPFPEPQARLEEYLRAAYLRYSLRREDTNAGEARYRFDIPHKALKKKILFDGFFETRAEEFFASLEVGPKFDLMSFLQTFDGARGDGERVFRHARVRVSGIEW